MPLQSGINTIQKGNVIVRLDEVLFYVRKGLAIKNNTYDTNGEYWRACFSSLEGNPNEEDKILTITRLNSDHKVINDVNAWGIPRHLILSDEWWPLIPGEKK